MLGVCDQHLALPRTFVCTWMFLFSLCISFLTFKIHIIMIISFIELILCTRHIVIVQ